MSATMDHWPGVSFSVVFGVGALVTLAIQAINPAKTSLQQLTYFLIVGFMAIMTFATVGIASDKFYNTAGFQFGLPAASAFAYPMLMGTLTLTVFTDYGSRLLPIGSDFLMFASLFCGLWGGGGMWPRFASFGIVALFWYLVTLVGLFFGSNLDVVIDKFRSNCDKVDPRSKKFDGYGLWARSLTAVHRAFVLLFVFLSPEAFATFSVYTWPFWALMILGAVGVVLAFLIRGIINPLTESLEAKHEPLSSIKDDAPAEKSKESLISGNRGSNKGNSSTAGYSLPANW